VLLADGLGRLPAAYREVIILSHLEGLGFPEVARRMGRSVDSVKNLWALARADVATTLARAEGKTAAAAGSRGVTGWPTTGTPG
jgi:RNA polymerase sigma-70 factor (ECF subfamily)